MSKVLSLAGAALLAAFAVFALGCGSAGAFDSDCILDNCADRAPAAPGRDAGPRGGGAPGRGFDFYVLALSWSAGFCELVEGARDQCEPGRGLGFVVHGLWPQYERGFPSNCPGPGAPSRIALSHAEGVFPDERLARYEWRKHGTCSGKSPSDYFADVARARALVTIPTAFSHPREAQTYAPLDIARAFYDANPRLRPGMMAVGCRRGMLQEVRICMSKDLREFRACPEIVQRSCRSREISVPAPM